MSLHKRGDIWFVNFDMTVGAEIRKNRPALVVSNDVNNHFSSTITLLPITDVGKKVYPIEVVIEKDEGSLYKESKIKCQQIVTVDKQRLIKFLGKISKDKLDAVEKTLLIYLGIER